MPIGAFRLAIASAAVLSVSGCSWITTFVVANKSDSPVTVEYRLSSAGTNMPACPDDNFVPRPRVIPIANVANIDESTTVIEYSCNPAQRAVKLTLSPRHAVSIFRSGTYTGHSSAGEAVVALSITGATGSVSYAGDQLTKDFKKNSDTLYVLSYI